MGGETTHVLDPPLPHQFCSCVCVVPPRADGGKTDPGSAISSVSTIVSVLLLIIMN